MADPLSAAGTAVGIVSLGLQVSQGLIKYYSHFKAHDEEIAHIVWKSESLQTLLQALERPLRKAEATGGDVLIQVRRSLFACEAGLKRLRTAAEKYGNLSIPTTIEKLRALKKRALYPFKRDTLVELNLTLEELFTHSQLALQILTLETMQSHQEAATQAASSNVQHFSTNLKLFSTKMDQWALAIQSSPAHSHLYREPALLASKCQEQQRLGLELTAILAPGNKQMRASRKPRNSICSCHYYPQKSESSYNIYNLSSYWSRTLQHLPQCPLSRYAQQRIDTIGVKYTYCTKLLGYSIAVTFSATRGPGGLAISPHLALRAIVPRDSPAFSLIRKKYLDISESSTPMAEANWILRQLKMLFDQGKASPTDITENGDTLLHTAVTYVSHWPLKSSSTLSDKIQATYCLIDGIRQFGADPLQRDRDGGTLIDIALQMTSDGLDTFQEADSDFIIKLFDYGLAFEGIKTYSYITMSAVSLVHSITKRLTLEKRLGTLEVSDLIEAVLCQDGSALEKVIARSPDQINQLDEAKRTALHLSAAWPEGISILLEGGARLDMYDIYNESPLYYACSCENFASVSLLLDHDSPLGGQGQNDVLSEVFSSNNVALKQKFIFHLVDRRKRLLDFALEKLPPFELESFNLKHDRILDAQASTVTSILIERGLEIVPALMPSLKPKRTSVYHGLGLDVSTADLLFEAGFRDVDEIDDDGMTPFWKHIINTLYAWRMLEALKWLKDKGIDVYHRHPKYGGTAIHALGANIGARFREIHWFSMKRPSPTNKEASIATSFFQDNATDDCLCACSKSGCLVITSALKNCRDWYKYTELPTGKKLKEDKRLLISTSILQLVEANIDESPWIPCEVIRVMTFEWLELTHTCHVDPKHEFSACRGLLSHEEIREIQEEERNLLGQHEDLVTGFEAKFAELGLPLTTFLKEHWEPAMDKLLEENPTRRAEEEQRMRELGIVVDDQDGVQEVESDEEESGYDDSDVEEEESEAEQFHDCEDTVEEG
ncbi:hypothetical protein BKA64DRAFT_729050 [Cadophora sp. MPI-SDFR-AT-0126]|nr:hypothetical protein BKA64DRAFT_729050 [Leotiomycetes sp. MPI-SDFR-AT-0126]